MIRQVKLDYDLSLLLDPAYYCTDQSCVVHQKVELADIHEKHNGFPDSYTDSNTNISQAWWNSDQLDFDELGRQLGMEVVTVSSIKQRPGNVIPLHRDTFYQINKKFPNDTRTKVRANLHLEDWKVGHIIQYNAENQWHNYTHWKIGEGLLMGESAEHLGANIGLEDKYTVQISGFLNE